MLRSVSRSDHDVLFGVLTVQLGFADPSKIAALADTMATGELTLADRLEADGYLSATQRRALEQIVVGTLAREPGETGLEDTLVRLGADTSMFAETLPSKGRPLEERFGSQSTGEGVTAEQAGRYQLDAEVGRGGLGVVRSAFDRHLGREVAVKELLTKGTKTAAGTPATGSTTEMVARFMREARVTAQIEHPNIVPVYELGRRPDGTLYYTMRLVRGRTLKSALHASSDLSERLALLGHFVDLCQAIAYAHSRGVIHRDIKPDNVMIGEFGETMVLDWGVAKVRGKDDIRGRELVREIELLQEQNSAETLPGAAFGTPAYMSPEQAEGRIDDIDERSDVWSLGVVLFQLLTGKLPITGSNLAVVLMNVARGDTPPVREVCPEAPAELAAVAERALSKDPSDRYQSAKELADEIEAYRSGSRVSAYEYSSLELVRRFLDRNRPAVFASLVGVLVVIVLGVAAYFRLLDERDRALVAEERSRVHLADAYVEKGRVLAAQKSWVGVTLEASAALARTEHPEARGLLIDAEGRFRPRLEWSARTFAGCLDLDSAPDVDEIACGTSFGVELLSRATGEPVGRIETKGGWVTSLAMSPAGTWIVAGDDDGRLWLLSRAQRKLVTRVFAHPGGVRAVRFGADGREVYTAGADGAVRAWFADELRPLGVRFARDVGLTSLDVYDGTLVIGDEEGGLTVRGAETNTNESAHDRAVTAVAFSPTGAIFASAGRDRSLILWDPRSMLHLSRLPRGVEEITSLVFSADGRWLLAGNEDGEIERYDVEASALDGRAVVSRRKVRDVLAMDDAMFAAGDDRFVRRFEVVQDEERRAQVFDLPGEGEAVRFIGEGEGVTVVTDREIVVWDLLRRRVRRRLPVDAERAVTIADDGEHLAGFLDNTIVVRDFADSAVTVRTSGGPVGVVALAPDLKRLAAGSADGFVHLRRLEEGAGEDEVVRVHDGSVDALAFTPDGGHVLTGGFDGDVQLLAVGAGAEPKRLGHHEGGVRALAAGDVTLVSGGRDGRLAFYDRDTARAVADVRAHDGPIAALAVSADGRYVASGGEDRALVLWDAVRHAPVAHVRDAHAAGIEDVAFYEDGLVMVSVAQDASVRVWSLVDARSARGPRLAGAIETYGVRLEGMQIVPKE